MNYLYFVALPAFGQLCGGIGFTTLILWIAYLFSDDNKCNGCCGKTVIPLFIALLLIALGFFIPSKKEMIELKVISAVTELKGADKIPQKLVDKLNIILEDK